MKADKEIDNVLNGSMVKELDFKQMLNIFEGRCDYLKIKVETIRTFSPIPAFTVVLTMFSKQLHIDAASSGIIAISLFIIFVMYL